MPYIGNKPAEQFTSFATQEFSTSATTSYTLDHAVANENEIALFINNVRQQPGSGKAYTATGTALTLSAATASTDTMYCVFLGRALQTVTPATNSITAAMVGNDLISGKDALTSAPADTDELLISDGGVLKRMDASLIGGGQYELIATADHSSDVNNFTITDCFSSTYEMYKVYVNNMHGADSNKVFVQILDSGGSAISGWDHVHNLAYVNEDSGNTGESVSGDNNLAYFKASNYQLSGNTTNYTTAEWVIFNPYEAQHTQVVGSTLIAANNQWKYRNSLGAILPSTTSGRSLKFYTSSSGNFTGYKVTVFGIKRT